MKTYIYTALISFLCFISCVEDSPSDIQFEEQIFVSGLVNNETNYVSLKIQKTVPVTNSDISSISDAQVSLFSKDTNDKITLISDSFNVDKGVYTSTNMITPIAGNSYWIEIVLKDGTILKSDKDVLRSTIKIKEIKRENNIIIVVYDDPIEEDNFYMYHLDFFKDGVLTESFIELGNDRLFNGEKNTDISLVDDYLDEGTTFKVSISNVSFNTYQYYSNLLNNQGENEVSLSSPINIIGNITNTNINRRSLGNFDVIGFSSLSKKF